MQKNICMTTKWIFHTLFIMIIGAGLNACSFLPKKHFPLSSISIETQTLVAQQQWQLVYVDEHYSLQVIVERTPTHWQWIMLNNLGQRLATARICACSFRYRLRGRFLPHQISIIKSVS